MSISKASLPYTQLLAELEFRFSRSGGPGGQNVNKVNSKATVRWLPRHSRAVPSEVCGRFILLYGHRLTKNGELLLSSVQHRDQGKNLQECLQQLTQMLRQAAKKPKVRRPTRSTAGSRERRLQTKQQQGRKKSLRRKVMANDD